MSDITTLIPDLQHVLLTPQGKEAGDEIAKEVAVNVGHRLSRALNREERARKPGVLFPAELGHPCQRKVKYDFEYPTMVGTNPVEELGPQAKLKFMYGDIIESLIIPLAKASGHKVEMVDERIQWQVPSMPGWSVSGRIDMVIDGVVIDVKSMNGRSFDKWQQMGHMADGFGYKAQIASYTHALGLAHVDGRIPAGGVLAINKENGQIALHEVPWVDAPGLAQGKAMAVQFDLLTLPRMPTVPDGKSGNQKLGVFCSYCKYRDECWRDANGGIGLRKFVYSYGPVWLTEVAREPRVQEES